MTDAAEARPSAHSSATPPRPGTDHVDFDQWSRAMVDDPYETWAAIRGEARVAASDRYGGFFLLGRYDDVRAAGLDTVSFSNLGDGTGIPPQQMRVLPQDADPPLQLKYRAVINPGLSPQAVAAHEPWVRKTAEALIDEMTTSPEFDFCRAFAFPFPRLVTYGVLGLPEADRPRITEWIEALIGSEATREGAQAAAAGAALFAYLQEQVVERQGRAAGDDLLAAIANGTLDGAPLSMDDMIAFVVILLFGGLNTTTAVLAGMMAWLADHPDDRARLRDRLDDRGTIDIAIEEFVRHSSPVVMMARTVNQPTQIGECPFRTGDRVALGWGLANHDPDHFERADEVVIDRDPNHHLGFGIGPHKCVGIHLARLQIRVALEELLRRLPDFAIVDRSAIAWAGGGESRTISVLPLRIGEETP